MCDQRFLDCCKKNLCSQEVSTFFISSFVWVTKYSFYCILYTLHSLLILSFLSHVLRTLKQFVSSTLAEIKANLHSIIFAYDCRMQYLQRALLASWKNRMRFSQYKITCRCDCRRVLKHVSKSHDIRVVHDNCKQVVGLIYTKRFVSQTCRKHIKCDKVVPCKAAFRGNQLLTWYLLHENIMNIVKAASVIKTIK